MNPEPPRAAPEPSQHTPAPRETLAGDRLCMRCLHPLAGRAIERDGATGLLFVRCGECGTASALFEYPTLAPWLARLKAVAAGTLIVIAIAVAIAIAGISAGFAGGTVEECCDAACTSLLQDWADDTPGSEKMNFGGWTRCDAPWLATERGQTAMARARWSAPVLVGLGSFLGLGCAILLPFAAFAGIALLARSTLARAIYAALPALAGSAFGAALGSTLSNSVLVGGTMDWSDAVRFEHGLAFGTLVLAVLAGWCALVAAISPSLAAGLARLILPPRDRRLVAWLWEWRGKRVPNR